MVPVSLEFAIAISIADTSKVGASPTIMTTDNEKGAKSQDESITVNLDEILDKICDGKQDIISFKGSSQYGDGLGGRISPSTCGLAALNFARIALNMEERRGIQGLQLLGEILSRKTCEDIISVCDYWKSDSHLEIEELLKVPLFKNSLALETCSYSSPTHEHFREMLQSMVDAAPDRSVVAIITRPPEIMACLRTSIADKQVYIIFDSHPRPSHPDGMGFIINPDIEMAASYLGGLLSVDENLLNDPSLQWQAQLLGYFSAHILLPLGDEPSPEVMLLECSLALLSAYEEVAAEKARTSSLQEKVRELERQSHFMQDRIGYLERQRREEHERYREAMRAREYENESLRSRERERTATRGQERNQKASNFTPNDNAHHNSMSNIEPYARHSDSHVPHNSDNSEDWTTVDRKKKGKGKDRSDKLFHIGLPSTGWSHNSSGHRDDRNHSASRSENTSAPLNVPGGYPGMDQAMTDAMIAEKLQREFEEEDSNIKKEHQRLRRTAPRIFGCPICLEDHPEDDVARTNGCDHSLCRSCMKNHAHSQIGDRRFPILCPVCSAGKDTNVPGVLDQFVMQQIGVSNEDYKIFEELQIASFCVPVHCRHCMNTMLVDRTEYQEAKIINCPHPECLHMWCKLCQWKVEIEGPTHSCDGSSELKHLMDKEGWKECPGCQTPVQKLEGCNHMTCHCNTHFCYIDGQLIIKRGTRKEIQDAVSKHYSKCNLFDYK